MLDSKNENAGERLFFQPVNYANMGGPRREKNCGVVDAICEI